MSVRTSKTTYSLERINSPQLASQSNQSIERSKVLDEAPHSCSQCWLLKEFCCCQSFVDVSQTMNKYIDVVVYTHFRELTTLRGSNTGKFLMRQGARRVVFGQFEDEARLISEIIECPKRCMVLYPSPDSVTVTEWKSQMGVCEEGGTNLRNVLSESQIFRPLVIVLDGTWNLAATLNRRLTLLLSAHIAALHTPSSTDGAQHEECKEIHLQRVRLERTIRNTVGTIRRIGVDTFKKPKSIDAETASVDAERESVQNEPQEKKEDVIQEDDRNESDRVNTMHAFIAFLEEYFHIFDVHPDIDIKDTDEAPTKWLIYGLYRTLQAAIQGYHDQTSFFVRPTERELATIPKIRKNPKWIGNSQASKRIDTGHSDISKIEEGRE